MEKRSLSAVFISNAHQVDRIRIPAYMYTINIFCLKIIIFAWICRIKEILMFQILFKYRLHAGLPIVIFSFKQNCSNDYFIF